MLRWDDETDPVPLDFWRGLVNGCLISVVLWAGIIALIYFNWHV